MSKLKCQFHCHTRQDPVDSIRHSERELIDRASKLGYGALAISCHNVVIFNDDLRKYAEKKRVLLIPAIEKSIEKKHVLILNADVNAQKIKTFEDLRKYKILKKDCFVIAPHPFYPALTSLGSKFEKNIGLFDAVEYSWFHSKKTNKYNEKAVKTAEKHGLPVIATSDNHILPYLDHSYSLLDADRNIKSIFDAIKNKRITIVSHDLPLWRMLGIYMKMGFSGLLKFFAPG